MTRPSADIAGAPLFRFAAMPVLDTLIRRVVPLTRSRTNTSMRAFVSPGTRLDAYDPNATKRPSADIANGSHHALLALFPCRPVEEMLTRRVRPVARLCTN